MRLYSASRCAVKNPQPPLHMFYKISISLSCESQLLTNNAGSCACLCTLSVSKCRYIQLLLEVLTQLLC